MNSSPEMGFPSGVQKEVLTIASSSLTLLSESLIRVIFLGGFSHMQGSFPHTSQTSGPFGQTHGDFPHSGQGSGGDTGLGGSGATGSPSQSGSLNFSWALW